MSPEKNESLPIVVGRRLLVKSLRVSARDSSEMMVRREMGHTIPEYALLTMAPPQIRITGLGQKRILLIKETRDVIFDLSHACPLRTSDQDLDDSSTAGSTRSATARPSTTASARTCQKASMGASCLDTFDVSAAAPRAPAVRGLLTTCPRNGLSNQLLALLSAAAVASDLGVGFWIPPLLVDNLQGPRAGASGAERVSFCASCYAALAQAETSPLAEVLNVTAFEAVGGVQLVAGGLPASFARGAVLDVCVAQHYELAIGESPCARDETWSSPTNWATPGPLDALPRRARGEAAYSCLRDATAGMLANTSTAAPKLWIKFGSSVQEYYQLCGRPPIVLPPFFELSREVVAVGAGVWPLLLRGLRDALRDRAYRACAHVRLSLPGEGWDQLGSPFTEAVPAQVHSFRDWLRRVLTKGRMPVLILSDAPWLLQRVVPELDDCLVTGSAARLRKLELSAADAEKQLLQDDPDACIAPPGRGTHSRPELRLHAGTCALPRAACFDAVPPARPHVRGPPTAGKTQGMPGRGIRAIAAALVQHNLVLVIKSSLL
ncbi:hypothetical protein T492DRAFT_833403 [Pavlovales sp. CCMP2436]|nr:hypothetical protein T492DRAFT_833403 [Pavlovales sp. CCMP2436]